MEIEPQMSTSADTQRHATRRRAGFHTIAGIIVAVVLSLVGATVVANAAEQLDISITSTFSPANVTIQVGTTVTWTNNDSQSHELRSTAGPAEFRTNSLAPGQRGSFTFTDPGTYTYVDHQNDKSAAYRGTIVVVNGAVPATPTPAPTPPPAGAPAAPTTASVHLAGAQFAPATVTVGVGGTVTWTNDDGSKHTVTADNGSFDSATLNAAATFAHTFTVAGTYAYGCDFHGNMRGTVIVTGAAGTPAPAPGTPTPTPPAPVVTPPTTPPVSPTPPPAAPSPGSGATSETINVSNNLFTPSTITVNVGSTISWANNDTVTHTVTADDQSFASGLVRRATSWSHTFAAPGTFTYFCEIHPEMTGTVIALAPDGSAPAAAVPAANNVTAPAAAGTTTETPTAAGATSAPASSDPATGSITIADSGFTPATFRVALGGTLTFVNTGKAAHTVTATDGSFDSDMIKSGASWAHTFTAAGSFTYSCILHPNMKGTVQVASSASGGTVARATESAGPAATTDTTSPQSTATGSGPTSSAIQPVAVDVADNQFNPNAATVAVGGTVTWTLSGAASHTVTADDQSFNSGLLKPGESYPYTFKTLGTFTYVCLVHPGMTGSINVVPPEEATAQQAATPAPTAGGSQAQPTSDAAAATAADPGSKGNLWGNTLLGIAAVLLACCALVFALRSFLRILGTGETGTQIASPSTESFTPNPI
jgi:plastocyanin